jgi:hypothetical protein
MHEFDHIHIHIIIYSKWAHELIPSLYSSSCNSIFSVMCNSCRSLFFLFIFVIVLSVHRLMDSDYHFGIFYIYKEDKPYSFNQNIHHERQLTITITIRIVTDYIFVERHICLLSTGKYALTASFRRRLVSRIFSKSHKVRSIYII